jgi:protein-disulfide isomerase
MKKMMLLLLMLSLFLASCVDKKQVAEIIKKNPEILTDAIKEHPALFIEALNEAVKNAQADQRTKQEEEERKKLEEAFDKPLEANIRNDELFRGNKNGVITIVEYSDFECPFCRRGYQTVLELLKKFDGKIRFVYKHLPLNFHPNAMPASQYYEALRIQNGDLAIKFHDELYENQGKIKNGESYFKEVAKKLGADMKKLEKDIKSSEVEKRIQEDMDEAGKFGFSGTPGFLVNGVPVRGAYPTSHFEEIIKKLQEKGKLKL